MGPHSLSFLIKGVISMATKSKILTYDVDREDGEGVSRKHATMTNYIWRLLDNTDYARGKQ